jgi:fermentation-respiration switch protein FrsA (DUF1100 family)
MTATPPPDPASQPKPKTPWYRKVLFSILGLLICVYIAGAAVLYKAQDAMIFAAVDYPAIDLKLPPGAQQLKHEFTPGQFVEAWYCPAPNASAQNPAPLIVYCHGNGEYIDHHTSAVERFNAMGWSVLLPEYRGYNRSDGSPSQAAILADNTAFLNQTLKRPDIDAKHVVFYGRSLGGGVACDLVHAHTPQGIILTSTFLNMYEMAKGMYVPPFLFKHPFRNDNVIESFSGPVLIAHGNHDEVIPFSNAQELLKLAKHPTFVELNCGHNDFPGVTPKDYATYWSAVQTFLDTVKPSSPSPATEPARM